MSYQLKTRVNDNSRLISRIFIMDQRMQNENDKNKLAEMERVRARMIAAYRGRVTQEKRNEK